MTMNNRLPHIPYVLFKWYCRPERYEELHGDLEELFNNRAKRNLIVAKILYWWDVIRCCQPYAWRKNKYHFYPQHMMISNYLKVSFRGLLKSPTSSFINVFGLAVSIGVCVLVYEFMEYAYGIDSFHEKKHEVYLSTFHIEREGRQEQYGRSPLPLGAMLKEDFAQISEICRIVDKNVVIKRADDINYETIRFVDPAFLNMLTFPIKWGTSNSLIDPSNIVLSDDMRIKYFGDINPLGEEILVIFSEGNSKLFKVTGVAEAFPKTHGIHFDFLIHFDNLQTANTGFDAYDWSAFADATLIQVSDPASLQRISEGMDKYRQLQNNAQDTWAISSFEFVQLADLYKKSNSIRDDISINPPTEAMVAFPIIGAFMLALACFTYVNIAVVSATRRMKEIGIRKTIGANRTRVFIQFMTENIFITLLAGIIGIILAAILFIPWFVDLASKPLEFTFLDSSLWVYLTLVLVVTGVVSGLYPALYISKFDAVKIFKGTISFGRKGAITKVLLGGQLVFTLILVTGAVMFSQNNLLQSKRSWGYDHQDVLFVQLPEDGAYEPFRNLVIHDSDLVSSSGSVHHLGKSYSTKVVHTPVQEYEVHNLDVDAGYFETMGIRLTKGRFFHDQAVVDTKSVVVNELLVETLALNEPLGFQFEMDSMRYEIIGVVADFHNQNFYFEKRPTIFRMADPDNFRFLSVKVLPGKEAESLEKLRLAWNTQFPELPFNGGYQDDTWGRFFTQVETQEDFTRAVALVAVLLAALGFYGLVTLNVSGRKKEFSIRKVLGAGLSDIAAGITRQYSLLMIVSVLIGAPIGYLLIMKLLDFMYAYPITGYSGVVMAVIITLMVLLAVAFTQVWRMRVIDPVEGLKAE